MMMFDDELDNKSVIGIIFLIWGIMMLFPTIASYSQPAFVSGDGYVPYDVSVSKYFNGHTFTVYTYTVSSYYGPNGEYALFASTALVNGSTVNLTKRTYEDLGGHEVLYIFTASESVTVFAIDGKTFTPGTYHDMGTVFTYGFLAAFGLLGFVLSVIASVKK